MFTLAGRFAALISLFLPRKKGRKRGGYIKRNKGLEPISDKRRKRMAETREFRDLYRCKPCAKCGEAYYRRDVHEIANGPDRQRALDQECALLALCRPCHDEVGVWPKPKQLALKLVRDPGEYDLDAFNAIVTRQVSQDEVDAYLYLFTA